MSDSQEVTTDSADASDSQEGETDRTDAPTAAAADSLEDAKTYSGGEPQSEASPVNDGGVDSPNAPEGDAPQEVQVEAQQLLDTMNDVLSQDDVQPGYPDANGNTETTWCNRAAERILSNGGCDNSGILDANPHTGEPDIGWTSANEMADNAANAATDPNSGISEVQPEQAQNLANQGTPVFAVESNPGDHGHAGIVAPSTDNYNADSGPLIGQAGDRVGIFHASEAFNNPDNVRYYTIPREPQ